ncbi:TetR/AcrR family transcriptional regulator [Roseibium litorale]|uniref:TetR/AcrR family transcriptional regulator n=1 Tax=Roseibium litorale TaxID=2803841 RepID=A0ABR9CK27_9HYPH|nr:TetR/AcrR family transcriptional regulator [Roseibium litorale]MBD8891195.1 TetR/AcrR family transcriptional regulator [Roseibium litorale]
MNDRNDTSLSPKSSKPANRKIVSKCNKRGRPRINNDNELKTTIIEAALKIFVDLQYAGTTMDLVASHCGISKRTLYGYFPSKTSLFQEMIVTHRSAIIALPGNYDHLTLEDALMEICRFNQTEEEFARQNAILRVFFMETPATQELEEILTEHGGVNAHTLLSDWIKDQVAKGRIETDDVPAAAKVLIDMMIAIRVAMPLTSNGAPAVFRNDLSYRKALVKVIARGLSPH